jgi:NOL1/NOP2/fmu family ribosome biogenesis protein
MKLDIYDSKRKKQLLARLTEQFGVSEIPGFLFETGKEKVRVFTGNLTIDELYDVGDCARVEYMGLYLFKPEEWAVRVGFDAALLLKEQVHTGVVDLTDEQAKLWMQGEHLPIVVSKGMYVMRHGEDVFGCGVSDGEKLINFVPKERRSKRIL